MIHLAFTCTSINNPEKPREVNDSSSNKDHPPKVLAVCVLACILLISLSFRCTIMEQRTELHRRMTQIHIDNVQKKADNMEIITKLPSKLLTRSPQHFIPSV